MCRLLAYAAPTRAAIADLIGEDQCETYRLMARLHDDGWGTAWLDEDGQGEAAAAPVVRRKRTVRPGYDDERLHDMMGSPLSRARIFHLRLATGRYAVAEHNSHPFTAQGLAFAHNGTVAPTDILRAMVGPAALAEVEGTTDSELYFALIREGVTAGLPLAEAAASAVRRIRTAYPLASLNSVTLSPTEMVVVNSSTETPAPQWKPEQTQDDLIPAHHDDRYYRLRCRTLADGSFVVASAGLDVEGWAELPGDSVTRIDLATMEVTISSLVSADAPAEVLPEPVGALA